jgi:hypothetical protein
MNIVKKSLLITSLLVASACATQGGTPATTIYQVENSYNAAATVIIAYKALPPCGQPTSPILCSKAEIIAKLKTADAVAYDALVAAENTVRSPNAGANSQTAIVAAQQAIAALTSITATLAIK